MTQDADARFLAPAPPSKRRFVVCGKSGSGKTVWVESHRRPNDLVFDMDAVAETIAQCPTYPRPPHVVGALIAMRQAFLNVLIRDDQIDAFVIISDPDDATRTARRIGAEVVAVGLDSPYLSAVKSSLPWAQVAK